MLSGSLIKCGYFKCGPGREELSVRAVLDNGQIVEWIVPCTFHDYDVLKNMFISADVGTPVNIKIKDGNVVRVYLNRVKGS